MYYMFNLHKANHIIFLSVITHCQGLISDFPLCAIMRAYKQWGSGYIMCTRNTIVEGMVVIALSAHARATSSFLALSRNVTLVVTAV